MQTLRWAAFFGGVVVVLFASLSIGKTLIVPRGLSSSLTALVSRATRGFFLFLAGRFPEYETKDRILVLWAPGTLLAMLFSWLFTFFVGFALMLWPLIGGFGDALRESGSSMLTLGFAGTPTVGATTVHFLAAAAGLIVVALQIAYLPTLYQAFNRRETLVTLLQSRAGAPAWGPEILERHQTVNLRDNLPVFYADWEHWAAEVAESHSTYPVLVTFRSPSALRSWLVGLLAVMDAAALHSALSPNNAPTEARLCIRMGFLCLRQIAGRTGIPYDPDPLPSDPIELTFEEFEGAYKRLMDVGFPIERSAEEAWPHFRGWRVNYESVAYALANSVVAPPGPWSGPREHLPGVSIIPQRPVNRTPDDVRIEDRPKGAGIGH